MPIAPRAAEEYPGATRREHHSSPSVRACIQEDSTMRLSAVGLIVTLTLAILMAPLAVEAQPPTKVYRIGWLGAGPPLPEPDPSLAAFWQGLHDLGYVEGQNLVIEYRYAEGQ